MLSAFANSLRIPELRQRIFFTFGMIFICRLIAAVPIPGVDAAFLRDYIEQAGAAAGNGGFLGLFNLFSGGALGNCAVGALGIMPYISASIILQLMTAVVPALERLAREGDTGRQRIIQYTRYLTVFLCIIQGYFLALSLERPGSLLDVSVVIEPGWGYRILATMTMVAATMLLMWLGEQITERGIGNGTSLIITVGIVSALPGALQMTASMFKPVDGVSQYGIFHAVGLLVILFLMVASVVSLTQAQRKIPVQYAKRVVGRKVYGGQNTFMPLRVNYSGVMPIIFGSAILMFPSKLLSYLPGSFFQQMSAALAYGTPLHMFLYGLLIVFFSYFWVATQFNPIQIADDLKKYGGYVPGIRPGKPTAEFLDRTMTRITLAGSIFLALIAIFPELIMQQFGVPTMVARFFGGSSLLIVVGVMLDTMRQVESHLVTRYYDGFLSKGKLRSRK